MEDHFHCLSDNILYKSKSSLSLTSIDNFYIDNKNNENLDSTATCKK